ncbi:MAG: hypothetical protein JXR58_07045 [Bacteroidales bacterium]|nr:hypothetical protein [Bacteroidales bacterium]
MEERFNELEKLIGENNQMIADKIVNLEKTLGIAAQTIENIAKSNMQMQKKLQEHEDKIAELTKYSEQLIKINHQITENILRLNKREQ